MSTYDLWYSIPDLSAKINVCRKTIWHWVKTGKLKSTRIGARHRISEADWKQFLLNCNTK
jgi:excisionase family DNA binding protein